MWRVESQASPSAGSVRPRTAPTTTAGRIRALQKERKVNACATSTIKARINYLQEEDRKVWHDLRELHKNADAIHKGRMRAIERNRNEFELHDQKMQDRCQKLCFVKNHRDNIAPKARARREAIHEFNQVEAKQRRSERMHASILCHQQELDRVTKNAHQAMQVASHKNDAARKVALVQQLKIQKVAAERERKLIEEEQRLLKDCSVYPELEWEEDKCLQRLQVQFSSLVFIFVFFRDRSV